MTVKRRQYKVRQKRRSKSLLWLLLGLVGIGAAAAVLSARRHPLFEDWEPKRPSGPPEPPDDLEAAPDGEALWIAGPDGNLYIRDGGEGDLPILFIHSLAGNGGQWALQLDHLRRQRRAVALDLRGHGESDPADDGDYSITALAADVAAAADQLGLRRFVLAGHSLGALVAIEYASRHPERVAALLLVDPNGDQSRVPREQIESFLAPLRQDPLKELEWYFRQLVTGGDTDAARWVLEDLRLTDENAIVGALESASTYAPLPALERYQGPKLSVISGLNNLPYSLHKVVPDLPTRFMPGTGHWLMMDRPEQFNQILDEFLDEVEGR
ncbi:MAG TPA: alpha/beta fold hydrolase [Thermoanaerobaculia bacterium]|nr:alpha/beta fold hydrolase [Thermoanaerobaculia bacterium]